MSLLTIIIIAYGSYDAFQKYDTVKTSLSVLVKEPDNGFMCEFKFIIKIGFH